MSPRISLDEASPEVHNPEKQRTCPDANMTKLNLLQCLAAVMFLGAILYAGFVLRIQAADDEPLWLDELHTSWCVAGDFSSVFARSSIGNQSPLFFWGEYLVFRMPGLEDETLALRLLPLFCSLMLLVSIPWIVFRLSGSLVGAILATLLACVDENFIFYSIEARPYSAVMLVAVWQFYWFVNCVGLRCVSSQEHQAEVNRFGWVFLSVFSLTLFYLHYTSILLIATEFCVWAGIRVCCKSRVGNMKLTPPLICAGCVALGMLPGLWDLFHSVGPNRDVWASMVSAPWFLVQVVAIVTVSLVPIALCVVFNAPSRQRIHVGLLCAGIATVSVPWLIVVLGTWTGFAPLAHYRFCVSSFALLAILTGLAYSCVEPRGLKILAFILPIGLSLASNPHVPSMINDGSLASQRIEYWSGVHGLIQGTNVPVILCSNLVEEEVHLRSPENALSQSYLKFPFSGLYRLDPQLLIPVGLRSEVHLNNQQLDLLERCQALCCVVRANEVDAERFVDELQKHLDEVLGQMEGKLGFWKFTQRREAPLNLYYAAWVEEQK